jgi:RNA polymerase sigma-70 factor (ECF subfamily)
VFTFFLLAVLKKITGDVDREIQLMELIAKENQNAFSELYDLYHKLLFRLIYSILKDENSSEDLLQEVFVQIWEKAGDYNREKGTPYSWIVTLTRNRAIDRIRSKRFRNDQNTIRDTEDYILPSIESDQLTPFGALEAAQRSTIVKKCLDLIPVEQKEVLVTAYFGGYSQSEIAEKYQLPLGTVKTRMRQGLLKLQSLLEGSQDQI